MKNNLLNILILLPLAVFAQVGIGTTAPNANAKLDVVATDKGVVVPRVAIANLSTSAPVTAPVESLLVYNTAVATGVGFHYWNGTQWVPLSGTAATDSDWTVVGNDMHNANSGNVGVGTTTPSLLLHVQDTAPALRLVSGTEATGLILVSDANGNANWGTMGLDDDWTVNGNDMYNANTGNVEVGTISTKPNPAKFAIQTSRVLLENTGNTVLSSTISSFSPVRSYELIGMYTDAGFSANAIYIGGYNVNNTTGAGYDWVDRIYCGKNNLLGVTLPITATAFNVASSRNYKKNISELEYGLKDVLKINPVTYQYTYDKAGIYTVGYIAEQVSEVIPEVVVYENDNRKIVSREEGKPVSMDYSKMNAVLVNAVKEQQVEIDILEKENSILDQQLTRLEKQLL
ncbi:MAG: tail fiber domain-containing protein [Flavobacteriaceae bacterium]